MCLFKATHTAIAFTVSWLFFTGCVPTYTVKVNSLSANSSSISATTKISVGLDPEESDLVKLEFGRKLEYLLREQGRNIVPFDEADVVLVFDFKIDSEMQSYTKYVHDPGTPTPKKSGSSGGGFWGGVAQGLEEGTKKSRPQQAVRKINNRSLRLAAIDKETKGTLWQANVKSTGSSGDIRKVLNYMVIPAIDLFGDDTGQDVLYKIKQDDPRVQKMLQSSRR